MYKGFEMILYGVLAHLMNCVSLILRRACHSQRSRYKPKSGGVSCGQMWRWWDVVCHPAEPVTCWHLSWLGLFQASGDLWVCRDGVKDHLGCCGEAGRKWGNVLNSMSELPAHGAEVMADHKETAGCRDTVAAVRWITSTFFNVCCSFNKQITYKAYKNHKSYKIR